MSVFKKPPGISFSTQQKVVVLFFLLSVFLGVSCLFIKSEISDANHAVQNQTVFLNQIDVVTDIVKAFGDLKYSYAVLSNSLSETADMDVHNNKQLMAFYLSRMTSFEPKKVKIIQGRLDLIEEASFQAMELYLFEEREQADKYMDDAFYHIRFIDNILVEIKDRLKQRAVDISTDVSVATKRLQKVPVWTVVGGIIVVILIATVLILNVFRPISTIVQTMVRASKNPEHTERYIIKTQRNDEIGIITRALNALLLQVSVGLQEMRQAEQQVRAHADYMDSIMNNIADSIVTIDETGKIKSANVSTEVIFGYEQEELIGENISILVSGEHKAKHDGYLAGYLETGVKTIIDGDPRTVTAVTKSGEEIPVELTVSETWFDDERVFVGSLRDVSKREEMQSQLIQAQKMEVVGQMTGGVAHDFNNMLTVVQGNLEILEDVIEDEGAHKFLTSIKRASERAAELTQRLLAFSRKQVLDTQRVNVNEVLDVTEGLISRVLEENITLNIALGEDLWEVELDAAQLENAILNASINARDSMPSGGVLTIESYNKTICDEIANTTNMHRGDYVVVSISDTGTGIPEDIVDRVFEPFFTTKEVGKGSGMGLSMIYGFTQQSGGYTKIYSEEGIGTTIKLYFPRYVAEQDAEEARAASKSDHIPQIEQDLHGTEKIMIVEDEHDLREMVDNVLTLYGYQVRCAESGQEALSLLKESDDIDLLLTDVVMPGELNGEQLAEAVKDKKPDIKVLFMSGYTRQALLDKGRLKPDVHLIPKPFGREVLIRAIREVLDEDQKAA